MIRCTSRRRSAARLPRNQPVVSSQPVGKQPEGWVFLLVGIAAVNYIGVAIPFVQRALGPRERLLKLLAAEAVEIGVVFQIGPAGVGRRPVNQVERDLP